MSVVRLRYRAGHGSKYRPESKEKCMKRRKFLGQAVAGVTAGSLAAPAIAQSRPAIRWRMAASWPKSLDTLFGGAEYIARRVADMTEGRFQIRTFAAGEIVPALQVLDAVQAGTVEMGHTGTYYYFGKDPAFALATSVPFGPNTRQSYAWWHFGGGAEAMAPLFAEYDCVAMPAGSTGCQMGGWFRKEIHSVADLKGMKFRVGGLAGLVMARLGVVPQMIGGPDIYPALEKGTIDAAEWVGPYDDEKLGFNKVAGYYYYPGWWEGGPMLMALVNQQKWMELPKAYQAVLSTACAEAYARMPAKYDAQNPAALRRLISSGTKLRPFPRPFMEACEKAAFELYGELRAKSAHWNRVYPGWKKFRDEQFLWYRVAETTYDTYCIYSDLGRGQ
jgi:TRAP-type mannitol/chloroaromatic compound transport system substrate-binding protein